MAVDDTAGFLERFNDHYSPKLEADEYKRAVREALDTLQAASEP